MRYPCGFQDVISIDKTDEHFRLLHDTKGRFVMHRITVRARAHILHSWQRRQRERKRQWLGRRRGPMAGFFGGEESKDVEQWP